MKLQSVHEARYHRQGTTWEMWGPYGFDGDEGYYVRNVDTGEFLTDKNGDDWYSYYKNVAVRKVRQLNSL